VPLSTARADINEVRIAQQFGLTFLPLIVARNRLLIEAHARAAGLDNLKVGSIERSTVRRWGMPR